MFLFHALRFLWKATAGHRLRPWHSPYLRWRMETYTGRPAASITPRDYVQLAWRERSQMLRFLRWTGTINHLARSPRASSFNQP